MHFIERRLGSEQGLWSLGRLRRASAAGMDLGSFTSSHYLHIIHILMGEDCMIFMVRVTFIRNFNLLE
jgi:hypothetical protein